MPFCMTPCSLFVPIYDKTRSLLDPNDCGLGDRIFVDIMYAKGPMTKFLNQALDEVSKELDYAIGTEIGECQGR